MRKHAGDRSFEQMLTYVVDGCLQVIFLSLICASFLCSRKLCTRAHGSSLSCFVSCRVQHCDDMEIMVGRKCARGLAGSARVEEAKRITELLRYARTRFSS